MAIQKNLSHPNSLTRNFLFLAVLSAAMSTPSVASQDYCEAQYDVTRKTGVLTSQRVRALAELDFSEAQDGVTALSANLVKYQGIAQLGGMEVTEFKDVSIQLVRNLDRELRVFEIHISSTQGQASYRLTAGAKIEELIQVQFTDERILEGRDPGRLPLGETLRLLGFTGEIRQVALEALQSPCARTQDEGGARLLINILRKHTTAGNLPESQPGSRPSIPGPRE